ncbi:BNR repeat-containing protein [Fodinibius salsisoli]|uniref:BNR repeat-containing protein n=1 Tax=Fodinibius salsisoli TaxID=2820877 RepID=A0ABT3PQH8_9BACT|nr:BNR repeat-containing protein [Fodinibius salsisoli]MCW9708115.1 BNR repeat-containing protein [Fodinibius salsisoli]
MIVRGLGKFTLYSMLYLFVLSGQVEAQEDLLHDRTGEATLSRIGPGWAQNSINAVIFRQNSLTTHGDTQFTGYYDEQGTMVLAKRKIGTNEWRIHPTQYKANINDAHNAISLAVDGNGLLHVSWGMHGQDLLYAQGIKPGSLRLTNLQKMTGQHESGVTYPAFYQLSDGDLLFMYRRGKSGGGNIMLNRYDLNSGKWSVIAHPLIDGEGERNAYMNNVAIDENGGWHISWTWRESWDVATNHDVMYAYSPDEGKSWRTSDSKEYQLPINEQNAEVVYYIPEGSELINQTSMTVNGYGEPVIATYWRPSDEKSPQYHIIWQDGDTWRAQQVGSRTTPFSLSGGGTKRIPISRPQIIASDEKLYLIFRDLERSGKISIAKVSGTDYQNQEIKDLYTSSVEMWEPTLDRQAWKEKNILYLFVQKVGQGDEETLQALGPQPVSVLKWKD